MAASPKIERIGDRVSALSFTPTSDPSGKPLFNTLYMANVGKAWVYIFGSDTPASLSDHFNISGIADNATGLYTATLDADFANTTYAVTFGGSDAGNCDEVVGSRAVGSFQISCRDITGSGARLDRTAIMALAFGDQ